MTTADHVSLDEFCLATAGSPGRPLHLTTDDSEVYGQPLTLEHAGTIVVRIGVDLESDLVAIADQRASRLVLLDVAIRELQLIRDTLAAVTPGTASQGRCTGGVDWGRCELADAHEGHCHGQTEAQWRASEAALRNVRPRVVA